MTKNELWEIWELAKKGNTYSRKPLPVEYIKEAEEYINGSNSTIEKKKTSWSAVYPMVLLKELGGENESIAKRILFVISQWRREGVISDYYYMFNDIDIAVKIGYSLPEIIEESIIRFKKNLSVDYIEPSLEKLWKYFTDENFAKFADNLFKNNIDTLIEKKNENHMFFTLLITASLLYKKDPVKYERYLKPIMDYAEKSDSDNSGTLNIKEAFVVSLGLMLNNLGTGLAASITGVNVSITVICTFILSIALLMLGKSIGHNVLGSICGKYAPLISGVLLIILGIFELIN